MMSASNDARSDAADASSKVTPWARSASRDSPFGSNRAIRAATTGAGGRGKTSMVSASRWVSPELNSTASVRSYAPGARSVGRGAVIGSRACSPVSTTARAAPVNGRGRSSVHEHVASTVSRVSLITTTCFSTRAPAVKLWPFSVNRPGAPAMYASSGRLFLSNARPGASGSQSSAS